MLKNSWVASLVNPRFEHLFLGFENNCVQESRAVARKPCDAAAVLFGGLSRVVAVEPIYRIFLLYHVTSRDVRKQNIWDLRKGGSFVDEKLRVLYRWNQSQHYYIALLSSLLPFH